MELQAVNELSVVSLENAEPAILQSSGKAFIEANTIQVSLEEIKNDHIIPVFIKDNEPLISHSDFIESAVEVVNSIYHGETILQPNVRLSHPVKGRIPTAKNKPANELLEHEKTLYYERMAFVIEIPTVFDEIDGCNLSLMVGGVKSLNLDNLYAKKGTDEHFKIFIGFKNTVCTNLCVWSDGFINDLKVSSLNPLKASLKTLIEGYNVCHHMHHMRKLSEFNFTEKQFALLIGKLRLFQYLPKQLQAEIPPLFLGDTQIGMVARDYYKDQSFCRNASGDINLWKLYNLFTGANKSSYIDNFINRSVNTYNFVEQLRFGMENQTNNWYLN